MTRNKKSKNSALVYSSEFGKMCPKCDKPFSDCHCRQEQALPEGDGIVRILRETKGRKGKGVTVIKGIPLDPAALKQLGKGLKTLCGTGGTVKDGVIEIQGDHRDQLIEFLKKDGWRVKCSGG